MHNSIPHGSWERDGLGLTVTFHYGGIDSKARPHVFSRLKHTDVWQQEESHGGAMLIPWQPEQEDLINDWKGFHLEQDFALIEKNIYLGSIPADVFALIWCFMFQYHTLQTVNDLIYQSWCVPWCQILLNPEGLFHFTKHYWRIKALQMQPEVWLLLLMIYINIKVRLKPKCFCIIERKQNVWCTRICFIFATSIFVIVSRKYVFASLFHFLVEMHSHSLIISASKLLNAPSLVVCSKIVFAFASDHCTLRTCLVQALYFAQKRN